jgi:hypothetical protein
VWSRALLLIVPVDAILRSDVRSGTHADDMDEVVKLLQSVVQLKAE